VRCFLFLILIAVQAFFSTTALTQVRTEGQLIETIIKSLQDKNSSAYNNLFPSADSMIQWVLQYAEKGSEAYNRMSYLQENGVAKLDFDSSIKEETNKGFEYLAKKGSAEGIHWDQMVFIRYELEKMRRGRGLINEKIAPLRFLGYVFVKDMLTRRTYAFTVSDIMQINGLWYGGELANIFEASTKEQFEEKLVEEKKRLREEQQGIARKDDKPKEAASGDTDEEEEDKPSSMKEVLDRKYYKGTFDNEISVQLYVRYIKGGCPEIVCSWEALFKFGDQDEYVKMQVTRTAEGKWLFSEDLGGMELTLEGDTYKGSWAASNDKTEYDVKFKEVPANTKKIQFMDEVLERGLYSR
jgi:hypothetical protein